VLVVLVILAPLDQVVEVLKIVVVVVVDQEVRVLLVVALLEQTLVEAAEEPQGGQVLETGLAVLVDLVS
tara:strand:- start:397 stop:603 length:207 start_codon:yes stop_codon:yes gene_type:complete